MTEISDSNLSYLLLHILPEHNGIQRVHVCYDPVLELEELKPDVWIYRNSGVVFDLERRKDKDCPVCHDGEQLAFRNNK